MAMSSLSEQTAWATRADKVFQTINGGGKWTDVTGDLATRRPGHLRTVLYVPATTNGDRIFVAAGENGDPGVFMMAVANPGV